MDKRITPNCINGYSLMMSLICFFLMLQILSIVSLYTMESSYLIQCNRQSTMDLSCVSYAKHIIENNTWVRKCHQPLDRLILYDVENIAGKTVTFEDKDTYIQIHYERIWLRLYYDDKYITELVIDS